MSIKITTPHAAALIWNYRDRIGSEKTTADRVNEVDQIVISTLSLLNISTSKSKSSAQGTFQITLAPTKNWVTVITPGSWIVLLMSQNKIEAKDLPEGGKADPNKVKFLGRVESVRVATEVNQATAARQTVYIVTGVDWGSVFNSILYVDPLARDASGSAIGTALRVLYEETLLDINGPNMPTSNVNVNSLKNLWGSSVNSTTLFAEIDSSLGGQIQVKPEISWVMPDSLIKYMGFTKASPIGITSKNEVAKNLSDIVQFVGNTVKRDGNKRKGSVFNGVWFDKYETVDEAVGIIQPDSIFGQNEFWQLLQDNCNPVLNEILCDIRWDENKRPTLALYKRIKPFLIKDNFTGKEVVNDLISRFIDLRTVEIPLDEIASANAGTNWRDKYNFIEILFDQSLIPDAKNVVIKLQSQEFDKIAFSREGFRPMMVKSRYVPKDIHLHTMDAYSIVKWKHLLREWYFDTHVLLNGSMTIVGQNNYIQVGDNIMFDARAISYQQNINSDSLKKRKNSNINPVNVLAHVESISHTFTVGANGERSFRTTINFVRGLIVDQDRNIFTDGRLDIDAERISPVQEKNTRGNFASSTISDPDPQKVDGE